MTPDVKRLIKTLANNFFDNYLDPDNTLFYKFLYECFAVQIFSNINYIFIKPFHQKNYI